MSASLTVVLVLVVLLALGLVALERGGDGAKEVALVATLGAVAAAGRVLFSPVPGVQPVTTTCIVAGAALGPRAGLAVGPIAGLISNSFLGQGPWTPPQMALWAAAGLTGALLRTVCRRAVGLALVAGVWGLVFSWAMNVWFLASFGPELSWASFTLATGRSMPFDVAHAAGNVLFALAIGPALLRLLERYARRVRTVVVTGPPGPPAPAPAPAAPPSRPPPPPGPPR
jgi:energy-coupling factor transport system substrate-specific component